MHEEHVVSSRPDRQITKKVLEPGDYEVVPFEDSRCKIVLSDVKCFAESGEVPVDHESSILSSKFDGHVLIGDSDCYLDKDIELVLQQMCCGELCEVKITYKYADNKLAREIHLKIKLLEVTEEQLLGDWSWQRLHEAAVHHKDQGVLLVKQRRITDAFRRFSKSLKMLVAIEPINPETISEDSVMEIIDLKIKLFNNMAHCQLHYNEYEAALELCNRVLKYDENNLKAMYRRSVSYIGLQMYEEAWKDIQQVLLADPNDKAALQKANLLKPKIEKIEAKYKEVIKKMFV